MFIDQHQQKGVGLIEVLVALLLLAIAVLGYVALQTKAIAASQESILKTQAQSVMKGLAENIRTNNSSRHLYMNAVNHFLSSTTKPKLKTDSPYAAVYRYHYSSHYHKY